jgi:hypothetical protein
VEINAQAFDWARRRYYELMQWDPEAGAPGPQCLRDLQLDALLNDMGRGGDRASP